MPGAQGWSRWSFLVSPKWLAWHVFIAGSVAGMFWLGDWQLHRAEAGNSLSWAYTFEWPFFAVLAVIFWVKTIRDEVYPPASGAMRGQEVTLPAGAEPPGHALAADAGNTPEDKELAAYNAYLARLHREARGHGKWHGWR
jgi:hypothetical protein